MKKLVAVTACPTGIAHTFMAAESLEKTAKEKDVPMKVETQGSVGVENELTEEDIREAHAVILAVDTNVDESRFEGKPVIRVAVSEAIKNAGDLIDRALAKEAMSAEDYADNVQRKKAEKGEERQGFYKHLMNGVSFLIPIVVAGGILMALSFFGGLDPAEDSFFAQLGVIGKAALGLMVPVLAGFIAYSIADKPGLAPGLVVGMMASNNGSGFLGGIIGGFVAGYVAKLIKDKFPLPRSLEGIRPVLVIPVLATLVSGILMAYVIGVPIGALMTGLENWLNSLTGANAILLGLLLGGMMAVDMGGPVNKTAYAFGVGLIGSEIFGPMAAIMAAGMTPPLGLFIATQIAKNKFSKEEREAGKAAGVMGISFITEGAIPFAAADPFRVIPSLIAGSAVAGALSMAFNAGLRVPHGGIFAMAIPDAAQNVFLYALAIIIGALVTAVLVVILKKKPTETAADITS
ncbi:PTS fructose transporter subunit IIBC [Halalkalibacillus sediminis]|uniref:PTS fructose transporter subunit IIBC n=1 Tax=Halalkalibacillus sediminis TaxID=2018042 RepID=A0A2I0QTM5_9BACI|nr:fructose-specific PTS transporter subunit EIIC [Halalkalibacillus sediminis]PKR77697.1 PTS fructose transporter subunit IIBC [Halalkalibacillus sediminis]